MSETAIVSSAPSKLHNGIRVAASLEEGSLLGELRAAYQMLGRKDRPQVKSLLLTLGRATAIYRERSITMTLAIITSNNRPIREEGYPRTWLLYKHKDTVEIHVRHDSHNRPFVLDKSVA